MKTEVNENKKKSEIKEDQMEVNGEYWERASENEYHFGQKGNSKG